MEDNSSASRPSSETRPLEWTRRAEIHAVEHYRQSALNIRAHMCCLSHSLHRAEHYDLLCLAFHDELIRQAKRIGKFGGTNRFCWDEPAA